jgi:CHAT domain-containing protein
MNGNIYKDNKIINLFRVIYFLFFCFINTNIYAENVTNKNLFNDYYEAVFKSDYESLTNLVEYIVNHEDPARPIAGSLEVISTFIFSINNTINFTNPTLRNKLLEFLTNNRESENWPIRYGLSRAYFLNNKDSYFNKYREDNYEMLLKISFDNYNPSIYFEITHLLVDYSIYTNDYVTAELRILNTIGVLGGQINPHLSMLLLSKLSDIYVKTGRTNLSNIVANAVLDIADINGIGNDNIYFISIINNLMHSTIDNGDFTLARKLLETLGTDEKSYINNGGQLTDISQYELLLAFYENDIKLAERARERYKKSGWVTPSFDKLFQVTSDYIKAIDDGHCDQGFTFSSNLNDEFPLNIRNNIILINEEYKVCNRDFGTLEKTLNTLAKSNHKDIILSTNSLSRSLEKTFSNMNFTQRLLSILDQVQSHYGIIPDRIINPALELLFMYSSSPAQTELDLNAKVSTSQSQSDIKKIQLFLNNLREREIFLKKYFDIYTDNTDVFVKNNFTSSERDPKEMRIHDESSLYDLIPIAKKYRTSTSYNNIFDQIKNNLIPGQAVVFTIESHKLAMVCMVSLKKQSCKIEGINSQQQMDTQIRMIEGINERDLRSKKDAIREYSSNKFNLIKNELDDLDTIFYVPSDYEWNLPLQSIWMEVNTDINVIYTPTLGSLLTKYTQNTNINTNYDYVGIGNPNYSVSTTKLSNAYEPIDGLTLRSLSYKNELENLSQLPNTEQEILTSSKVFQNSSIFLKDKADEYNLVKSDWNKSKIIHFATHAIITGELDGIDEPALVLSMTDQDSEFDGLLTATDIRGFNFPSSLIVLSGCQTATDYGQTNKGGISGLSLSFLAKGAKSLIVTQWRIPDKVSASVMAEIMSNIKDNDFKAIYSARDYLASKYDNPYDWSAYIQITTPSRYNYINDNKETTIAKIHTSGEPSHIISSHILKDLTYVAVNSSFSSNDTTPITEIFELNDKSIEPKLKIKEYGGRFIGPSNERYMATGSVYGQHIIKFSNNYEKVIEKINITPEVEIDGDIIISHSEFLWTKKYVYFVYMKVDKNQLNEKIILIKFDHNFKQIEKYNITEEINRYKANSNETVMDSIGNKFEILEHANKIIILVRLTKSMIQYKRESGGLAYFTTPVTNLYQFNENNEQLSFLKSLENINILEQLNYGSDVEYLANTGQQKTLIQLNKNWDVTKTYEDITDIDDAVFVKLSNGENLIYTNHFWEYSDEFSYFNKDSENSIRKMEELFDNTEFLISSPRIYSNQIFKLNKNNELELMVRYENRRPEFINLILEMNKKIFAAKLINLSSYQIEELK